MTQGWVAGKAAAIPYPEGNVIGLVIGPARRESDLARKTHTPISLAPIPF
jgi:hypothetical protein